MEVNRAKDIPTNRGGEEMFRGRVWLDTLLERDSPGEMRLYRVFFEPGARTGWHRHPDGQALLIVVGKGRVQAEGQPGVEVLPGDVVYSPPGELHWHGAAPDAGMTHLAVNPGGKTQWDENRAVTDEEYLADVEERTAGV
ncbi:MAG: cupin domain-containing protein [Actinomycetota bacterium]